MFRNKAPVPVFRDLSPVVLPDLRNLQALHVVTHRQHDMIGYKPLIHQLKDQLVHHFLHDEFSLSGSISAVKDLPFAYAVVRRPVGLDLRDGAGFPSPCVIDQKLRVDPEETVQDLLVLH